MNNIFHTYLQYTKARVKLQRLAAKYGFTHRLTIAQGNRVNKLHTELQRSTVA